MPKVYVNHMKINCFSVLKVIGCLGKGFVRSVPCSVAIDSMGAPGGAPMKHYESAFGRTNAADQVLLSVLA
jgi:hypothetical protein